MNTCFRNSVLFLGLVIFLSMMTEARAQDRLAEDAGYLDLHMVDAWFDTDATLEINVKEDLLKAYAAASYREDPPLSSLLRRLRGIQVRGFSVNAGGLQRVAPHLEEIATRLDDQAWEAVVRLREEDKQLDTYLKIEDGTVAGLIIISIAPRRGKAVFMNIVGEVNANRIADDLHLLRRKFPVPRLLM